MNYFMRQMGPAALVLVLLAATVWADTPRNLGNTESPVSARCVAADGLTFESCGGTATISGTVAVTESGTWTVQPGNTANTTAWKTVASGDVVRMTQILGTGNIPSTATDATSATSTLPTGLKTFLGVVTCTGTCIQTQKIYGTYANAATVAASALVCTLTISGTTTASDWCATDRNFSYWFVVTTLTSGTTPLSGVFVQY